MMKKIADKLIIPQWNPEKWKDFPENPLIEGQKCNIIGDPQIILSGEYDKYWHMYSYGKGIVHRFRSNDGIKWEFEESITSWGSWVGLVYLYQEDNNWYMLYSKYIFRDVKPTMIICMRVSKDLISWSDEAVLLIPELPWEVEGKVVQVRNPCLIKINGIYRLYYCGGTVWFDDCGYEEPKYVGFAEAKDIAGPYKKYGKPILEPDPATPHRNFGSGALKVFLWQNQFLGFYNGIYKDKGGGSRSAISLMASKDGIKWMDAPFNPIIFPTTGWKKAIVYQLDVVWHQGRTIVYYNARDGWREGAERIGASELIG